MGSSAKIGAVTNHHHESARLVAISAAAVGASCELGD
jgi:hypothetical protein